MGKLFTDTVGNYLTTLLGNYLTGVVGKALDIPTLSRFHTQYMNHNIRRAWEEYLLRDEIPSFEETVTKEIDEIGRKGVPLEPSCVRRGLYASQIERYLKYFEREQLMIVATRGLRAETRKTVESIAAFVGLRPYHWKDSKKLHGVGEYRRPMQPGIRRYLSKFYQPYNERLYELLDRDLGW